MATKTFEELKQLAIQIRDEKTNKQNTATRIGTQMLEHLDKLEQDYYDKTATDEELKERDEKLTELEGDINSSGGGALFLNFKTDIPTTRLQVPIKKRRSGLEICYKVNNKWKREIYTVTSSIDSQFKSDLNWIDISNGFCNASFAYPNNDTSTISKAAALIPSVNYKNNFVISLTDSNGKSNIYIFNTSSDITYGEWTKSSNWRKIVCIDEVYTKEESDIAIDTSINEALYDLKLSDWGVSLK